MLLIEEEMLQDTYLFVNIMFLNKVNQSIAWAGKGKDRVAKISSIYYQYFFLMYQTFKLNSKN